MVQLIKLGSVFILTLMLSCSSNSDSVVVEDVRVLTMESDEILENQTIIVDEGLIS